MTNLGYSGTSAVGWGWRRRLREGKREMHGEYEEPTVVDYGSLTDMTEAQGFINEEDGGSKLLIHHIGPSAPAQP